ncbi:MAG: Crp/Fnr family transcriptional regulator [Alphaproteobacteria bacterium]|nr:Crp/Fnr family transcriptional regulator [Alphaproteobacteria bacterium]
MPLFPDYYTDTAEDAPKTSAGISEARLDRNIENNLSAIKNLSLFKNVPPLLLSEILRSAHIVSHNKGEIFLTHGETVAQFYVVLEGWVKIFKSSADGKEAILQILGKNEHLTDTGIFSTTPCTLNVQAIENVKLLALPLSVTRQHFMHYNIFAENMMDIFSARAKQLLNHLEQLTLRSAPQRVGWAFLKLWLDAGADKLEITLPFDKSIIAAYLDIRPETFSRILRNMQKDGFTTNGQRITLPSMHALCAFCDPGTAQFCNRSNKPTCAVMEEQKDRL